MLFSYVRPHRPRFVCAPSFCEEYARGLRDGLLGYPVGGTSARYIEGYTSGRMKYLKIK